MQLWRPCSPAAPSVPPTPDAHGIPLSTAVDHTPDVPILTLILTMSPTLLPARFVPRPPARFPTTIRLVIFVNVPHTLLEHSAINDVHAPTDHGYILSGGETQLKYFYLFGLTSGRNGPVVVV